MLQHKFNVTSAIKTQKKHQLVLKGATTRPKYTNGADVMSPKAQISGSHVKLTKRNRCARAEPSGTPINPAVIATRPNLYETLFTVGSKIITTLRRLVGVTYSLSWMFSFPGWSLSPRCMNFGPNQARAPATNATQVKPAVDSMNDLFLQTSLTSSMYEVVSIWAVPSLWPRSGSSMKKRRATAIAARKGVTLNAQCHDPKNFAVSDPTM